ncbi:hypothetical protein ABK040_010358 [Willaertia magna]
MSKNDFVHQVPSHDENSHKLSSVSAPKITSIHSVIGKVGTFIPSLCTVMNVMFLVFIIQAVIILATTFGLLFTTGEETIRGEVFYKHLGVFENLANEITNFVKPSEYIHKTIKLQLGSMGLLYYADCPYRFGKLISGLSTFNSQISYIHYANYQSKMVTYSSLTKLLYVPCVNGSDILSTYPGMSNYSCNLNTVVFDVNEEGIITRRNKEMNIIYNPQTRPWWVQAINMASISNSSWGDIFTSQGRLSITHSIVVYSDKGFVGVAAVQYLLQSISDFLNTTATFNSQIIVLDRNRNVLASSLPTKPGVIQFPKEFNNSTLYSKLNEIMEKNRIYGNYTFLTTFSNNVVDKGRDYYYSLSNFIVNGLFMTVVVVTEETSFLKRIVDDSVSSLVIFILVLSLGIVVLIIVMKSITYPLEQLTEVMNAMTKVDEVQILSPIKSNSLFSDVRKMQRACEKFRSSIHYFSLFCPEIVVKTLSRTEEPVFSLKSQNASLLIIDLKGISSLQKSLNSVDIFSEILNNLISDITVVTHSCDGFLAQLLVLNHLKIIAIWNDELSPVENHEVKAANAALECKNVVEDFMSKLGDSIGLSVNDISMSMILTSGNTFTGCIGSSKTRMNFSVFGEALDTAHCISQKGYEGATLVIDDRVFQKIRDDFLCYYIDTINVDSGLTHVYSVVKWGNEASAYEKRVSSKLITLRNRKLSCNGDPLKIEVAQTLLNEIKDLIELPCLNCSV